MSNYQVEIDEFINAFSKFKNNRIALYGIGRRTATLIPALYEWNIIGVLDKDPENIGRQMYGVDVISLERAEKEADIIIINAPETYWKVIYARISHVRIPVYYLNGERAKAEIKNDYINPYWDINFEYVLRKMEKYQVISFDLFDTLIGRKEIFPESIWDQVEWKIIDEKLGVEHYKEKRKNAIELCEVLNPNLREIYDVFVQRNWTSEIVAQKLYNYEVEAEKSNTVVRTEIVNILNSLLEKGKSIYIISDMHLPRECVVKLLQSNNIEVKPDNIFISCEYRATKASGQLWEIFKQHINQTLGEDVTCIHIGDADVGDVEMPKKVGVDVIKIYSYAEMLSKSIFSNIYSSATSRYAQCMLGLFANYALNSPFALHDGKGKITIKSPQDLGYILFGPVIYTFLRWVEQQTKMIDVRKICFFARDGYFLEKDFKYLYELRGITQEEIKQNILYLEISRRSTMVPTIIDEVTLADIVNFPYNGTFSEFMEDRFAILVDERSGDINERFISTVHDYHIVYEACLKYYDEIIKEASAERKSYLKYLKDKNVSDSMVFVDLFFYGNTQYYLSKLLGKRLTGMYFACDVSSQNRTTKMNTLIPCFQNRSDEHARHSLILKHCLLIESFLTAPNGMLQYISQDGQFVYANSGKNQNDFGFRECVNEGVKNFIADAEEILRDKRIKLDTEWIDTYYGEIMEKSLNVSEDIKEHFYFDNALIQRREMKIIE